jgi:hypothetical protein
MENNTGKGLVLIAGGSGLIGKHLSPLLMASGYKVVILSRKVRESAPGEPSFSQWNPEKGEIDENLLRQAKAVINLAGDNIGEGRWTEAKKQHILRSRETAAQTIASALAKQEAKLPIYIGASAVGIYGDAKDQLCTEQSAAGQTFLAKVCLAWEAAHRQVMLKSEEGYIFRIGVVLDRKEGALPKMMQGLPLNIACIGSGQQCLSWIHVEDLCRMMLYALDAKVEAGTYNAVSPQPNNMKEFTAAIAAQCKPLLGVISVPEFIIKTALGEMSALVLESQRCSCKAIQEQRFEFKYADLSAALKDLLSA